MSGFWTDAAALVPPIGVGLIFWYAVRALVRADRSEREAADTFDDGPGESPS